MSRWLSVGSDGLGAALSCHLWRSSQQKKNKGIHRKDRMAAPAARPVSNPSATDSATPSNGSLWTTTWWVPSRRQWNDTFNVHGQLVGWSLFDMFWYGRFSSINILYLPGTAFTEPRLWIIKGVMFKHRLNSFSSRTIGGSNHPLF